MKQFFKSLGALVFIITLTDSLAVPGETLLHYRVNAENADLSGNVAVVPNLGSLGAGIPGGSGVRVSTDIPPAALFPPVGGGNRSMLFNGSGGVLAPGTQQLLNSTVIENGGFTYETWFKFTGGGNINSIIDYAGTEKLTRPNSGSTVNMTFGIGTAPINQWRYVAVVFTPDATQTSSTTMSGKYTYYLDGVASPEVSINISSVGDSLNRTIAVGMHPVGFSGDFFNGLIYEPRVSLGALEQEELLYRPPSAATTGILDAEIDCVSLDQDGDDLVVTFDDLRPSIDNTHYELQYSVDLETWRSEQGTLTQDSINFRRHSISIPDPRLADPSLSRGFYRVLVFSNTAEDSDGDGLSNSFELDQFNGAPQTNPSIRDSDGDGFDDGTEYALGTDPNNINQFPELSNLPSVAFGSALSCAAEGKGPHFIPLVMSAPYSGPVHLSVDPDSTAIPGVDYEALPAQIFVSGTSAILEVRLTNNTAIYTEPTKRDLDQDPTTAATVENVAANRQLLINLTVGVPSVGYRAAGAVTHVMALVDDDTYWTGVLSDGLTQRTIRVCIQRDDTSTSICFVSGSADGQPALAGTTTTGWSPNLIPTVTISGSNLEQWPANNGGILTSSSFQALVSDMPADTRGFSEPLKRSLELNAETSASHVIAEDRIIGTYTETIRHASDESITYVNRDASGTFYLARDLPQPASVRSAFDPADGITHTN